MLLRVRGYRLRLHRRGRKFNSCRTHHFFVDASFSDTILDTEKLFHLTVILKKNKIISFNVNKIFFILTVDPVLKVLGNVCIPTSPTL